MIHVYGSRKHYLRHLLPVAEALGGEANLITSPGKIPRDGQPILIAGAQDIDVCGRHPISLMAHGAEQTYVGLDHRSWSGGGGRSKVGLFLVPRREVGEANIARYPDASYAVVGCPALDSVQRHTNPEPLVVFTFHVDFPAGREIPELRSAFGHYRDELPRIVAQLRADGCRVVGHAHPRWRSLLRWWRAQGVETCEDWPGLLEAVDVLVADNTSALAESVALGAGTVWLNAPWYRRDVKHGCRFWDWPRFGTEADDPGDVVAAVRAELRAQRDRPAARRAVYTWDDNGDAERAATAVRAWTAS